MDAEFEFQIGTTPPVGDLQFEKFWTAFSEEAASNRAEKSTARNSFCDEMFVTHRAALEAMDLLSLRLRHRIKINFDCGLSPMSR
ncbi:hypothetical protein [Rhodococcoides yunnanense]|uniref:hypothetical protein n=1 Tax=Rhodococcoides yunnanense TaxID=278209 RepID=UPI0009329062|nr:hypothetical protein [Rhodococcus yunnanensis]